VSIDANAVILSEAKDLASSHFRGARFFAALRMTGAALFLFTGLIGCGPTRQQRQADEAVSYYFAGDYPEAQNKLRPLAKETNENFVLNNVRLGSAALADYDLTEAEDAFLRAYEVINSVGVNDGGRSLGAVLVDEKIKIWKGEPFERAMANFDLGLVYYIEHDYNNARAAFENALFKLHDYDDATDKKKNDAVESNFLVATLMLARSWQKLGREDLARANFDDVKKRDPSLAELADYDRNAEANLLLVVEFGYGPQKVTDMDGSIVGFGPPPYEAGRIPNPRVVIDGHAIDLDNFDRPTIDLLAMAQDRKWQSIDTIRTVKSVLGTGLLAAGGIEGIRGAGGRGSGQRRDLTAAAALAGAGLLLKATSQADVRQWEMLPRTIFLLPLKVEPGTHDITVDFPMARGVRQTWRDLVVPATGEATYYFRMQRFNPGPFQWPPPAMTQNAPTTSPSASAQ
jgi:tetratricopeptide (TPR) repeat protein